LYLPIAKCINCYKKWDGDDMHDISERLTKALPKLPKKLAIAARYALDCPERIALDSMRTVATTCDVASPTMLRLARALEYNSYEDFRAEFQQNFVTQGFGTRADALKSAATLGEGNQLIDKIAQAAERNIAHTIQLLDTSIVEEFAQSVKLSRRTYILGTGSSMHWMAAMMASVGEMALPGIRSNQFGLPTSLETLASIDSSDTLLVMSISPYSKNSIDAAAFAKARKAKVFALTDKRSSPLVEHADHVFFAPTESPHYYPSVVSTVLMIEILLSAAVAASDTLDRIKQIELVQNKSGAYL